MESIVILGYKNALNRLLLVHNTLENNSANLVFNIDGLPLFKSSGTQLWPILAYFNTFDIFIIAIYGGDSKPSPLSEFLEDFVYELRNLIQDGFDWNGKHFEVAIKCFLCDAPARAFLKGIIAHTGYNSCERCCVHGSHEGRAVFNEEIEYPKRDWKTFKIFGYRDHQLIVSPLVEINTDVINLFPLDYMHLVCLGAVRRILNYLKKGPCGKISANNINEISMLLLSLNGHMPSEFIRQPRSLKDLDRWKATEFRQFLLYSGPVVLRNILSDDAYQHFLALSITLTILLQSDVEVRSHYLEYSQQLIRQFVYNSKYIYGNTFTVYNIHNLLNYFVTLMK